MKLYIERLYVRACVCRFYWIRMYLYTLLLLLLLLATKRVCLHCSFLTTMCLGLKYEILKKDSVLSTSCDRFSDESHQT